MDTYKVWVHEYEEFSGTLVVKVKKHNDSTPWADIEARAYNVYDLGGEGDLMTCLKIISWVAKEKDMPSITTKREINTDANKVAGFHSLENQEYVFTEAELIDATEPDRQAFLQYEMDKIDLFDAYPTISAKIMEKVLQVKFERFNTIPYRNSMGRFMGLKIANLSEQDGVDGVPTLLEMQHFDKLCTDYGIPSVQIVNGNQIQDKDAFSEFLVNNFGFTRLDGPEQNCLVTPINVTMYANRKRKEYEIKRDEAIDNPVTVNVSGTDYTFDNDAQSRNNLNDTLTTWPVDLPPGFVWRDADNNDILVTRADLVNVALAMAVTKQTAYITSWQNKQLVKDILDDDIAYPTNESKMAAIEGLPV